MSDKVVVKSGGIGVGFFGLLTLIFITLKLCGVINWSWFWVISPLLIGPAIFLFLLLACVIFGGLIFGVVFLCSFVGELYKRLAKK